MPQQGCTFDYTRLISIVDYQKIVISEEIFIHLEGKPFRYLPIAVILTQSITKCKSKYATYTCLTPCLTIAQLICPGPPGPIFKPRAVILSKLFRIPGPASFWSCDFSLKLDLS